MVLPTTDAAGAAMVAEAARQAVVALQIPHTGNAEGEGRVTVSVGASTALSRDGASMKMPGSLLLAADAALYQSKKGGRNRVTATVLMASQG